MLQQVKSHKCSPSSFLLLGLRDDARKRLLDKLVKNVADNDLLKIFTVDLSKYSDENSLLRLKSNPVSNDNKNSVLLEAVKKHPFSIFYFDKIEKAHITVYGWLPSLLRCGFSIDDQGKEVDFGKNIIYFGSDCGNKHALAQLVGHNREIDSTSEADCRQLIFKEGEVSWLSVEVLDKPQSTFPDRLPGWIPPLLADPFDGCYEDYLATLPFV